MTDTQRTRVLFVDDEDNILQGLRRSLRPFCGEWDMSFAISGEDAVAALRQQPHDVVVSDMRMPGMSGSDLLRWIAREQPETLRIILSGQADQEGVLRSVGPAHQFLSKPCEPELLTGTIRRALQVRSLITEPRLQGLVSRLGSLPSMPGLYEQLVEELQSGEPSGQRIGTLIASDMAMSAKILQLVNSAFFGISRQITSVTEATHLLGLSTVKSLVLAAGAFDSVTSLDIDIDRFLLDRLWSRALLVSGISLQISKLEGASPDDQDAAVSAGLLHDLGLLILTICLGDEYQPLLRDAAQQRVPLVDAEHARLGATHAQVGAYLLGTWGIPLPVVEAVAYHHQPTHAPESHFSPLAAVHVAAALADEVHGLGAIPTSHIDRDFLAAIGKLDRLPAWRDACASTTFSEAS